MEQWGRRGRRIALMTPSLFQPRWPREHGADSHGSTSRRGEWERRVGFLMPDILYSLEPGSFQIVRYTGSKHGVDKSR